MQIFLSTVVRQNPLEQGGELIHLDWAEKKVVNTVPLVPTEPAIQDPNARGSSRGGRGIVRHQGLLYVALYHSIGVFDLQFQRKGTLTHPLFAGLHEVFAEGDRLWVAATAIDAALCIDFQGQLQTSWWAREEPFLQNHFGLEPLGIDKTADNRLRWLAERINKDPSHTHLNAVAVHNGELLVLLNRFGTVYNVTQQKIVLADPEIVGCHNLVFLEDRILINDSRRSQMLLYDHQGNLQRTIDLLAFPDIHRIYQTVRGASATKRAIFVRGLSVIDSRRIMVGFSPATLAEIDLQTGALLDWFQYSDNAAVCVHGLLACSA
jgi:hypothetical protein